MRKCPHCDTEFVGVDIESVTLTNAKLQRWTGLTYSCPACHRVLSIGFDPVALNLDLLESVATAVVNRLRNS